LGTKGRDKKIEERREKKDVEADLVLKKAGVEEFFKAMSILNGGGLPDNGVRKVHGEGSSDIKLDRIGVGEVHLNNLLKKAISAQWADAITKIWRKRREQTWSSL